MKRVTWMLAIGLFLFGCNDPAAKPVAKPVADEHGHEDEHTDRHVVLSPEAQKIAGVKTVVARTRDIQSSLILPGTVTSTTTGKAVVTPPIAGRLVQLNAKLGAPVMKGQVLAVIESPELAAEWSRIEDAQRLRDAAVAEVSQANSEIALATAKVRSAGEVLRRQKELARAGAFSQAPVQQAQSELNDAQSELLSVQKEQASHADQLRRLENLFRDGIVSKSELEAARLELQQDQIRLDRAKAKIENAKATYEREKNIAGRGLLNAKELQTAEADLRSAQLELDRSRLRLRSAQTAVLSAERSVLNAQSVYRSNAGTGGGSRGQVMLVAPISGTITHIDVTPGQAVDRTQALLEVEDLNSVWVTANVPEKEFSKVQKGVAVEVSVASLPGQTFPGIVQVVGSRIDPKTRSIPAQCLIPSAGGRLKPDMFATVRVGVGAAVRAVVVPKTAIVTDDGKSFVFVKSGDEFEKSEVELGSDQGELVAIRSGVKSGDVVVFAGGFVLLSEQKKADLKGHEH
jgi:RND family efflux transporter MFP subunit